MTRYKWVAFQKAEGFPIATACKVAGVSRQGFHAWRKRQSGEPSEAEVLEAEQVAVMREIEQDFDCTYGEPRMTPEAPPAGLSPLLGGIYVCYGRTANSKAEAFFYS